MLLKTIQVFTIRGFGSVASFLVTLVLSHVTTPERVGVFMISLAVMHVLGGVATIGSQTALIKVVASNVDKPWTRINQDQSFVIKAVSLLSVLVMVLFLFFPEYIAKLIGEEAMSEILSLVSFGVFLVAMIQVLAALLIGKQKPIFGTLVQNVISQVFFIVVCLIASFNGLELNSSQLLVIYLSGLFISLVSGGLFWFSDERAMFIYNSQIHPELRNSVSALFIILLMGLCVQWAGQFASARFLDAKSIAYFSVAQRTALLASFVLIAVNLVVVPKIAAEFSKGRLEEVDRLSLTSSRLMVALAIPVLIIMLLFPEFLMGLFGTDYKVAAESLQVMAVGQFINVITGSVGYLLNVTGHERDMRNVVILSGVLAVILAFTFTYLFGILGAAYATAIALASQNLIAAWMVKKRLGFNTLNIFRRLDVHQ